MTWTWPLLDSPRFVPEEGSPGSFGAVRKYDVHTGVDLYTWGEATVVAVEPGTVVAVVPFTGPGAGSPWWEETEAVMVEGGSGVVCYGEVSPRVRVGDRVAAGFPIGTVRKVLRSAARSDIPGHSPFMLHLELYTKGTREPAVWEKGALRPGTLLDPTPLLLK